MADTAAAGAMKTEVGHEAGGGHQAFPPFETATFPSQLLWLAITFGALYYFMSKKALPAVGAVIENRKARIARDLDDAAAMQQQADAAAAAHARMLSEARRDAQAVAQAARDRLTADSDARRKTLEGELAAKLAAAEAQIAATRTQAMTNVGAIARDAASAIFERLLGRPADASAIDSAIASVKST
jgi:F-type H+-transporting ATPase subunit b